MPYTHYCKFFFLIKPNNGKESNTTFTQQQSVQEQHGDKKHLLKQNLRGGE